MEDVTEDIGVFQNETCEIIQTSLSILATLSDTDSNNHYDEEVEDIIKVKTITYKVIIAAQQKLLKQVK